VLKVERWKCRKVEIEKGGIPIKVILLGAVIGV